MTRSPFVLADKFFAVPQTPGQRAHHEERKLGRGISKYLRRIGKWDFIAVGVATIDVVKPNGNLCYNFQTSLACFEDLGIDRVAKSSNQSGGTPAGFFENQRFRRCFCARLD